MVSTRILLEGAWYSLHQCGVLLSDAMTLYKASGESSAVGLAMLGREELGKHRILMELWRESERTGTCPTVEDVRAACEEHVEKQRNALLSWSFTGEPGSALDTAIRTQLSHHPQDAEYRQAEQVIQTAHKAWSKRAPDGRHQTRMAALYVDLDDSGLRWKRPAEQVIAAEAKKLLTEAVNDYAVQRDRMDDPGRLRELGDPKLADALGAWPERVKLPEPVWP
jgi:AbiV family abortive infection protein